MNELNTKTTLQEESVSVKGIVFGIIGFATSIMALVSAPLMILFVLITDATITLPLTFSLFSAAALIFCIFAKKEGNRSKIVSIGKIFGIISAALIAVAYVIAVFNVAAYYFL